MTRLQRYRLEFYVDQALDDLERRARLAWPTSTLTAMVRESAALCCMTQHQFRRVADIQRDLRGRISTQEEIPF